jgi:hypothetical protein
VSGLRGDTKTSEQRFEGRSARAAGWDELTVRRHRQLLTAAAIRSFASGACLGDGLLLASAHSLGRGQVDRRVRSGVLLMITIQAPSRRPYVIMLDALWQVGLTAR